MVGIPNQNRDTGPQQKSELQPHSSTAPLNLSALPGQSEVLAISDIKCCLQTFWKI